MRTVLARPLARVERVSVPNGGASYPFIYETARTPDKALPRGRLRILDGQSYGPADDVLAPVLRAFFLAQEAQ